MTKNKPQELPEDNVYIAALSLLNASGKIFASLVSFSAVAYLMGWVCAKSYFGQFGSEWLAGQLSPIEIFSFSLTPLYYFAISFSIALSSLDEDWPRLYVKETVFGLVFGYVLLPVFFGGFTKAAIIQRSIDYSSFAIGMLGAVILALVAIHHSRRNSRAIPGLLYVLTFIAGWLLPVVTGTIRGRNDRDVEKSSLPLVAMKGNASANLRLLCISQGHYYIFEEAARAGEKSHVFIAQSDEISYFVGNENPSSPRK